MLQVSLIAYAVSGAFLELASFDLYYHVIALAILLKRMMREKVRASQEEASTPRQLAAAGA